MARIALILLRLVIGGVFVYAGVVKAGVARTLGDDIRHYDLVPWPVLVTVLAVYLPWVEIAAGLAVLCRRLYLGGLVAIAGLMIVFTAALGSAWARGLDISCGCFGNGEAKIREHFPSLLARDLGLLAGVGVLLVAEGRRVRGGGNPKTLNPGSLDSSAPSP